MSKKKQQVTSLSLAYATAIVFALGFMFGGEYLSLIVVAFATLITICVHAVQSKAESDASRSRRSTDMNVTSGLSNGAILIIGLGLAVAVIIPVLIKALGFLSQLHR